MSGVLLQALSHPHKPAHERAATQAMRNLVRCLELLRERDGNFTCKRLAKEGGIDCKNISVRTIRRAMNKEGFKYLQARKKGILRKTDLQKRLSFAKKMKRVLSPNVWKEDINFF